jgi:hypothetical protein
VVSTVCGSDAQRIVAKIVPHATLLIMLPAAAQAGHKERV